MAYIQCKSGNSKSQSPFLKGYYIAKGQNISTQFNVKKNDILFVLGNNIGGQYETVINGNIQQVTSWHQVYSTGYQKVFKVTSDGTVTLTNKTTAGSCCFIISKNGKEIDCQTISCSANSSVSVSNIKENDLFMTSTYNTNYTILTPSSDGKTTQLFNSYNIVSSAYLASIRANTDADTAIINSGYYVTEILRFR